MQPGFCRAHALSPLTLMSLPGTACTAECDCAPATHSLLATSYDCNTRPLADTKRSSGWAAARTTQLLLLAFPLLSDAAAAAAGTLGGSQSTAVGGPAKQTARRQHPSSLQPAAAAAPCPPGCCPAAALSAAPAADSSVRKIHCIQSRPSAHSQQDSSSGRQ
jgi:hypothetical protein